VPLQFVGNIPRASKFKFKFNICIARVPYGNAQPHITIIQIKITDKFTIVKNNNLINLQWLLFNANKLIKLIKCVF